jgi:signal transduction histidine kinase/CheY-like chemotaxis protein
MLSGFLRSARFGLSVLATLVVAGGVIGFTWYTVAQSTNAQRREAVQQADAIVTGLAASYAEQISRQTLALDQTLAMMVRDWQADPGRFNLEADRERATILTGISRDMFLADENGIVRQSSVPDFIGQSVADLDVFRDAAGPANQNQPSLLLGSAAVNPIMRQWHLDAALPLHHPDGSFAGIIDTDYRVSAITGVFAASAPTGNGFAALIGLTDGKLRAAYGATGATPDASVADTKMFAAVEAGDTGLWIGPTATDAVVRIHAFRRIPGRDLAVIAGLDQREVMQPVATWQWQARLFAGIISGLTVIIAVLLLIGLRTGRRRAATAADTRANLAASQALAEVSRAHADAIERRLRATFAAIGDGVGIFDAHLNLVEWNELFPERCGLSANLIRTGMAMEDVLRSQVEAGHFGAVKDVEAEVGRRIALLRAGNFGASLSFQTADRVIELRCRPLAEGGFVALYTDVTEARRARQALWDTREALGREQSSRMRTLDVIGFELNARVATLARSIDWLWSMDVPARMLEPLRRVWESLSGLAIDAVELPRMEAGAVALQPALVEMRPLLRDLVDAIQPVAQDRGIMVYQVVDDAAPAELIADSHRIRQILRVLILEALRFAAPDTMWLLADGGEAGRHGGIGLRIIIRGFGAPIPEAMRASTFPTFEGVAVPANTGGSIIGIPGTGLGPAIARHLTALMGGQLSCEAWSSVDGRTGNDFTLTFPPDLLPGQRGRAPGQAPAEGRALPRTRVLMVGAATGLRMAAATMLRRDGHMVDVAASREAAVQSLRLVPYDIAFIDGTLPDTSAEVAIAAIRDLTGPARIMPLIVLAQPHDEADERPWHDSGADDILAANPTLEDLISAIRRHVWFSRSFTQDAGAFIGPVEEFEDGIPLLSAARITELRANLPREELLEMVEECIADLFHRLPALRRSLATGATGAITAQTHAMVGMAGGYGMAVLEARLRAILTAVRTNRLDTIDGAAAMVEADLTRAAAALRRTLRSPHQASSGAQT